MRDRYIEYKIKIEKARLQNGYNIVNNYVPLNKDKTSVLLYLVRNLCCWWLSLILTMYQDKYINSHVRCSIRKWQKLFNPSISDICSPKSSKNNQEIHLSIVFI